MNNAPLREPDAATYGALVLALLFIWPIPFFIASVIVAPFMWLFGIEPQSALHWWSVGITGCLLIAAYVGRRAG